MSGFDQKRKQAADLFALFPSLSRMFGISSSDGTTSRSTQGRVTNHGGLALGVGGSHVIAPDDQNSWGRSYDVELKNTADALTLSGSNTSDVKSGELGQSNALGWLFGWTGDGPMGSVSRSESQTNGVLTDGRDVSMGWDKDGYHAKLGENRTVQFDENNVNTSSREISYQANQLTVGGGGATRSQDVEGGTVTSTSGSQSMGYGAKGFALDVARSESRTNGVTSDGRDVSMGWDEKGLHGRVASSQSVKFDDHNATSSSRELALAGGQATYTRSQSERSQDHEKGAIEDKTSQVSVGFGKNGPSYQRSTTDVVEYDGQKIATSNSRGYQDGKLTTSSTRSVENADGTSTTTGTQLGVGKDGASGGYDYATKDEHGNTRAHQATGSIDLANNSASAGYSYANKGKDGTDNGSVSVNGKAGFNENGDLDNASLTVGGSYKGVKASVSGEYKVDAGEPREQDGVWIVDYSRTVSGGAQGGGKGITIGGKASEYDFGTRTFKTKAEADTFQKNAASMLPSRSVDPTTATGALAMQVGEARGVGDASSVGISGELQMNVTSLGAGYESGSSSSTKIERVNDNVFLVTRAKGDTSSLSGTAGVGPVGVTRSSTDETSSSETVRFDLATPEGRAAFDEYNRTGELPAKGGEMISETDAKKHRAGTGIAIGSWGSASISATTFESVTRDASGKTEVYGGENADSVSWLGDEGSGRLRLVQTERNDAERTYSLQAFTESTEAWWNRQHLANYSGYGGDGGEGPKKASGKWRVDMELTEKDVQEFVARKLQNERKDASIFGEDERVTLTRRLHDAKTTDDQMRAMAAYVAEDGFEGDARRHFEDMLGRKLNMDVALEGDRNFQGSGARYALEDKIERYQTMMNEAPGGAAPLVTTIQADIEEIKRRKAEILDTKKYTDMPMELRLMEARKFDTHLDQLLTLRGVAATEATKLNPGENWGDSDTAYAEETAEIESTQDPHLKQLKLLRRELQSLDAGMSHSVSEVDGVREDLEELFRVMDFSKATYTMQKEGWAAYQKGKELAAQTAELRAQFVLNLGNPTLALSLGHSLKVLLTAAGSLHDTAYTKYFEAMDSAATDAEGWRDSYDYDPDDVVEQYQVMSRNHERERRRNAVLEKRGYRE